MDLHIKPTSKTFSKASAYIGLLDASQGAMTGLPSNQLSKLAKNIKTLKPPVIRYFEAPGTISTYFSEGEFDLVAMFKFLKYESFFLKATQKKLAMATKSGFSIVADNDEVTEYFDKRFLLMMLSTGVSLKHIIRMLLYYLIVCSNAFVVKVRDKDFEFASSYKRDGKEMHPVVGYFLVHPTTMKPRFKYIKDNFNGQALWKWEIDSWVQTNRKGQMRVFDKEDVIHFTMFKEDGMILGMPDVVPVIDDIRTLRKIEEDIQLLIYRDLFPIIHYTVESPKTTDHINSVSELDRAKNDMQHLVQDGGIATDARHKINFVGNSNKSLDATPYLSYFKERVWVGLGVSSTDMAVAGGGGGDGQAQEASKTLIDTVKFLQQELSRQFEEQIVLELYLQSPFSSDFTAGNLPKLLFQEIDIEWKIRQENHDADLFTKGSMTIHELRNKRGEKTLTDEEMQYLHPSMFGDTPATPTLLNTGVGNKFVSIQNKLNKGAEKNNSNQKNTKSSKSASDKDIIKSNKSNSNIVKKKATDYVTMTDSEQAQDIKDKFSNALSTLKTENGINKVGVMFATKFVYDEIKENMKHSIKQGIEDAYVDMDKEYKKINIQHDIFSPLDKLRDDVTDKINKDFSYINKGANRVAMTNRTEQNRAYNYGYTLACIENDIDDFTYCSSSNDSSQSTGELIGKQVKLNKNNLLETIPPFHPNSSLTLRCVNNNKNKDTDNGA